MEYSLLNALNDHHDNWRIRVRICRLWESTNPQREGELISVDMILIDEKENLMHATIRKHLISRFKHLLAEGSVYSIRNLKIVPNTGTYRTLSCEFKALFQAITSVKELEGIANIPTHGFQIISSADVINSRVNDKNILTDVVGCLCGIGGIEIVGNNWKKRDLQILSNHSLTTTITLWGKLGEDFDPNLFNDADGPYVIVVTSTIVKKFKGAICFSTTNNSKIYINLDTPYMLSLKEKFSQHPKSVKVIASSDVKNLTPEEKMFFHRMCIKELVEADWSKDLKDYVATVRGEIVEIDNSFGWYYLACNSCDKKVILNNGVYKCDACQKTTDYPLMMFKIHIKVKDQTGATTLVLFNNVAEPLLDTSAKKLLDRLSSSDSNAPKEIQALLGKVLVYKLRLNHYNLRDGYQNFTVSEVFEPKEILEQEYEAKKSVQSYDDLQDEITHDREKILLSDQKKRKRIVLDDEDNNEVGGANK